MILIGQETFSPSHSPFALWVLRSKSQMHGLRRPSQPRLTFLSCLLRLSPPPSGVSSLGVPEISPSSPLGGCGDLPGPCWAFGWRLAPLQGLPQNPGPSEGRDWGSHSHGKEKHGVRNLASARCILLLTGWLIERMTDGANEWTLLQKTPHARLG